jgi:hypothetical protein
MEVLFMRRDEASGLATELSGSARAVGQYPADTGDARAYAPAARCA